MTSGTTALAPPPSDVTERMWEFTGRDWVLDSIDAWVGTPWRMFLLTGTAGSGKSMIAARLVEMSRGEVEPGGRRHLGVGVPAYAHFCRARDDRTLDPLRFIEALSEHLSRHVPAYAEAVLSIPHAEIEIDGSAMAGRAEAGATVAGLIINSLHIGNMSARLAFDRLIRRPLEQALDADAEPLVILIDGLDEALSYGDDNLVELIATATAAVEELPVALRLLLTSRPDERVLELLELDPFDLVTDAPMDADDVLAYSRSRLHEIDQARREAVARRVAGAAEGSFLYARYVIEELLSEPSRMDDPAELDLPPGLSGHYRNYLRRELVRRRERWEDRYRPLLGLLAVARGRGLPRSLIMAASDLEEDRVDDALRVLSQYVSVEPDGSLRLYHLSFREFLIESREYCVYPTLASRRLAETLLNAFPNEQYTIEFAPTHLVEALQDLSKPSARRAVLDRLSKLLTDPRFLAAKLHAHQPGALLADIDLVLGLDRPDEFDARGLSAIHDALRLAAPILANDPDEFSTQLWARLRTSHTPAVDSLRQALRREARRPWLRPVSTSVIPAGHPLRMTLPGMNCVNGVVVSPDDSVAMCHDDDSRLWLWELRSGALRRSIETDRRRWVNCSAGHAALPLAVAGRREGGLLVIDLEKAELLRELPSSGDLHDVAISLDGSNVLSVHRGRGGSGKVEWRAISGEALVRQVNLGVDDDVTAIVAAGGTRAYLGVGGQVQEWDIESGECVRALGEGGARIECLALSADGGRLAVGRNNGRIDLWDLYSSRRLELAGHHDAAKGTSPTITGLAFSADGERLVSCSTDTTLRVWECDGRLSAALRGHSMKIYDVAVFSGGSRAISVSKDGTARVWDLDAKPVEEADVGHEAVVDALAARGRITASGSADRRIAVWHHETGAPIRHWDAHIGDDKGWINAIALSPEGNLVYSADENGKLHTWTLQGVLLHVLSGNWESGQVALAADVPFAVSQPQRKGTNDELSFWNATRKVGALTVEPGFLTLAISADAATAVAVGDKSFHVIDPHTCRVLWSAPTASDQPYADCVTISADLMVAGFKSGQVEVWDLTKRELRMCLPVHRNRVVAVAISPDGTLACSVAWDWALRVWSLDTGDIVASYSNDDWWSSCIFTDDIHRIVAGDVRGGVHFLELENWQPLDS